MNALMNAALAPLFHFAPISKNGKTGPIPVTTSPRQTCPDACAFKGAGCYAENAPLVFHWNNISKGKYGIDYYTMMQYIRACAPDTLWRANQAGDLVSDVSDKEQIDVYALADMVRANKGKRGFTYTHFNPMHGHNARAILDATADGFTINASANSLRHADQIKRAYPDMLLAVVLPADHVDGNTCTPEGHKVIQCPATYDHGKNDVTCMSCNGLCQKRRAIIGFPAHGARKAAASKVITLHR